ncbi:MAG: hypothetical protein ACFHU9_14530 [Fluviicola sp.]
MKKLLILPVLAMALFACNMASDEDYKNMAQDVCDCINKSAGGVSDKGMDIILDSGGDQQKIMDGFQSYAMEDMAGATADMQAFEKFGSEAGTCIENLKDKYDDVYTSDNEEEVQDKMLEAMKGLKGCGDSYKLLDMSLKMMRK